MNQPMCDLIAEIEKLTKSRQIGINWNDIPTEIKMKCVGKMDFKTGSRLRICSKTDNYITDATKCSIDRVFLDASPEHLQITVAVDKFRDEFTVADSDQAVQCLKQVLKRGKIDQFWIHTQNMKNEDLKMISIVDIVNSTPSLCINYFAFSLDHALDVKIAILEKSGQNLDEFGIELLSGGCKSRLEDVAKLPKVLAAKNINLTSDQNGFCLITNEVAAYIVDKWIEMDAKIGGSLTMVAGISLEIFEHYYKDRIITKNVEMETIRIRTENPEKHILIRNAGFGECSIVPHDYDDSACFEKLFAELLKSEHYNMVAFPEED
ncbi:unnamed protein product [Caenorhabditis sp. 36 PRJEB53466]|nr:unnamed protein product [Caenorhabditis sp. 36 PRJEB53466]